MFKLLIFRQSPVRDIDQRSAVGFRDHCILLVFLHTGSRLSELVILELARLHLDQAYLKVLSKEMR